METLYFIVLVPMFYVAALVFICGTVYRIIKIARMPKNPTTLQIFPERGLKRVRALYDAFLLPTVLRHNPLLWVFLMAFHICFLLLIIGHLELIRPFAVIQIIEHEVFLGGGFIGLILCVTLIFFLFRRFFSPNRELSVPEDYFLLVLLFITVLFGSQMDWARNWYEYDALTVDGYREYLSSVFRLRPQVPVDLMYSGHAFMLVLHVFFANIFLIFFPFSKMMHTFFTLPMSKLRRG